MKLIHATRKERAAFFSEVAELGLPIDHRYRHSPFRTSGKRTRRQRQESLSGRYRPSRRSRVSRTEWRAAIGQVFAALSQAKELPKETRSALYDNLQELYL